MLNHEKLLLISMFIIKELKSSENDHCYLFPLKIFKSGEM